MTAVAAPRPARRPVSPRDQFVDFAANHRSITILVGFAIIAVAITILPLVPPLSLIQNEAPWYDAFANAGIYVLLAMGLNVVIGLAGLLDLGYAAFFAIGAYTYAYSNSNFSGLDLPFLPMLVVGAGVAAVFGIALGAPTLRLRGDYLAIMTLGFGEIVPIVFLNLDTWTQGTNGISGIYRPEALPLLGEFSPVTPYAYMILMAFIVAIAMCLMYRLQDSRLGRAWNAVREDELAAAANGINTVTTKLLAFALGATTAGLAGVFSASKLTIVSPDQFYFQVSFTVLAMVILGGLGNIWGVALGAFIVYLLQVIVLKQLNSFKEALHLPAIDLGPLHFDVNAIDFTQYQFLLFGFALVLMMLFRPEGLFPSQRRRRELHIADDLAGPLETDPGIEGALGETPGVEELLDEDAGPSSPGHDR
jgi:ABC-type branched-subunit amino acid transport system permease subunit